MDLLKQYWYIALGVLILVYFAATRNSGAGSLIQTRAGTDTVALAQIASAEREADEARRFGVAGSLLQYDLSLRGLDFESAQARANNELNRLNITQQVDIARISADSQSLAYMNALELARLQAGSNDYANQLQYQLGRYQTERQYNAQRRTDWAGAITSGIQTILPTIFGESTSGGNINFPRTPPTFPRFNWSF